MGWWPIHFRIAQHAGQVVARVVALAVGLVGAVSAQAARQCSAGLGGGDGEAWT